VTILQSKPFVENAQALSWVDSALEGDQKALENLSKSLRPLIFNLCQKFFLSPEDAEDNTQEILIRVITKLGLYDRQKGQLITWVLRIAKNHLLDFRRTKGRMEAQVSSFDQYFSALEQVTDAALGDPHHVGPEDRLLAMEANASCLLGMLLCLEQKQRLVIILGDVLEVPAAQGGAIMGVSKDNFRQLLSRARKELHSFMHQRCGLINKANPCRCHKKAKGFLQAGWLHPEKRLWADAHYENAAVFSEENAPKAFSLLETAYAAQFRGLPSYDDPQARVDLPSILADPEVKRLFRLN
jgi:RNA polymerase sigma factor (sigma-70 family)